MQVGISTASLFTRRENEDALRFLNGLGVPCVEVFLTTYRQYNADYGRKLLQVKGNLQVNSVHDLTSQFEPQLFSAHQGVREDSYEMLAGVLEVAKLLNAPYYSFHGLTRAKRAERIYANDDFPKMIKNFQTLSAFCAERGVTLCLENVEWSTYNRPGVFATLAKEIPTLRGVLDIKQARLSEYPYEQYLEEMGGKLAYVHLSDVDEQGKMCLPGQGVFNFQELLRRLRGVGFDGALLIEAYAGDYKEEGELKASCEYLQALL